MTTVQKKELLAAVLVLERDKYLEWLTENRDMNPDAVSKLIAYLAKSEAIYKQAEREVTQAHNEGMTDPNRVAAQSEKGIVHK
jgi:putative SOS response-associated peptidase YedK